MKLFRILPLAVIALTLFASCDETIDNDLEVEKSVRLSVSFKNPDLDLLWGEDWKTDWQYDWDSSDTTYGTLGYSTPEIFKGTIYNLDANTGKRYSNFFKLFGLNENPATLPSGGKYDILLYNTDTETSYSRQAMTLKNIRLQPLLLLLGLTLWGFHTNISMSLMNCWAHW